jgi:RNA-splicing ligase RtcB
MPRPSRREVSQGAARAAHQRRRDRLARNEAPGAYKDIETVLTAHGDTINIEHVLRPVGVAMAGADVFDPFKD